jgi:hypothetical protein
MSRGGGRKLKNIRVKNYIFYLKIFYKYIKDFKKDRNILYYEMKDLEQFVKKIKDYNITKYMRIQKNFIKKILKENILSVEFKSYLQNFLNFLQN